MYIRANDSNAMPFAGLERQRINRASELSVRGVVEAHRLQLQRAGKSNALLDNSELTRFCHISGETLGLLEHAAEQLCLFPRACHRILKVARTIADLDRAEDIACEHIAEAIAFRRSLMSGNTKKY